MAFSYIYITVFNATFIFCEADNLTAICEPIV
jgi:hypothetical protein